MHQRCIHGNDSKFSGGVHREGSIWDTGISVGIVLYERYFFMGGKFVTPLPLHARGGHYVEVAAVASIKFVGIVFHKDESFVTPLVVAARRPLKWLLCDRFDRKSQNLYTGTHPVLDAPLRPCWNFVFSTGKTRMIELPYAKESMMIY